MRMGISVLLLATLAFCPVQRARGGTITFDFDTGTPALWLGANLPLTQTSVGVTALFSVPAGSGSFFISDDATQSFSMSLFSGLYLVPSGLTSSALDLQFSQPLTSIMLAFATADFQQVEVPTSVRLNAYMNATTTPVGSAQAHGTYASDTMPMGTLSFDSGGVPFNLVHVAIVPQPLGSSVFLADNFSVTPASPITVVPEPGSLALLAAGVLWLAPLVRRARFPSTHS